MAKGTKRCALLVALVIWPMLAKADTIGSFVPLDANEGSPSSESTIYVGDLVRISLDGKLANEIPVSSIVSGNSVRGIGLVKDATSYGAFYVAERVGVSTVAFQYVSKATGHNVVVKYTFNVELQRPGRLLELQNNSTLMDVATGKPPVDGARVGDVIRFRVGAKNGVESIAWSIISGSALRKGTVATEGDSVYVYFSAERPGTAAVTISYRFVGAPTDAGFLSKPIEVGP